MMQEVVMENINDILQVGIKQTNNMPTVLILKGWTEFLKIILYLMVKNELSEKNDTRLS